METRNNSIRWPSDQGAQLLLESMTYVDRRPRIVAPACSTILRRVAVFDLVSLQPLISCEVFNSFTMEFWLLSRSRSWDSSKSLNVKRFKGRGGSASLVTSSLTYATVHGTSCTSQGIDYTLETLDEIYRLHHALETRAVTHASVMVWLWQPLFLEGVKK